MQTQRVDDRWGSFLVEHHILSSYHLISSSLISSPGTISSSVLMVPINHVCGFFTSLSSDMSRPHGLFFREEIVR